MILADKENTNPMEIRLGEPGEDRELKAIAYIASVLRTFTAEERSRMLEYLSERFPHEPIRFNYEEPSN